MKKFLLVFILMMISLPVLATEVTLKCSCIVKETDYHIQLEPMALNGKGQILIKNKKSGTYTIYDDTFWGVLENAIFSYDTKGGMFIYSIRIDGKDIPAYGACQIKDIKK